MMGAGLAKAAIAVADALELREHAPARIYFAMALTALDRDAQPTFYGGRDALVAALAARRDRAGYAAAERAVRTLVGRGLIDVAAKGVPGRPTRYRILNGRGAPLTPNTPRSAWGESESPHAEQGVNNSEHPTLNVTTPHAERAEHPTLNVGQRNREEKEESQSSTEPHDRARDVRRFDRFDLTRFRAESPDLRMLSDETLRRVANETLGRARGEVRDETAYVLRAAKDPEWISHAMNLEWDRAVA